MGVSIISSFGISRGHHRYGHANAEVRWRPDRLWLAMTCAAAVVIALAMFLLRLTWW